MTWRCRWFLALAAGGLIAGLLLRQEPLALASLALLTWIGLEWINFAYRTLAAGHEFARGSRSIAGDTRSPVSLIVDQQAVVEVTLNLSSKLNGLRCVVEDLVPSGCAAEGPRSLLVDGPYQTPLHWRYVLLPRAVRRTRLPGLRCQISDPQGLFRQQRFLPLSQDLTILPFVVRPEATVTSLKRHNIQLLAGMHRHRSEGTSTELHGIRDYRVGDPPRAIAWKATARLGRLLTCEYESEVPARATILADLSPAQYLGRPGPAPVDRIISASASVARLLMADRDPVACLLLSQTERTWLPHGLGERHLTRLLWELLSRTPPLDTDGISLETLTEIAWASIYRRFPELLDPNVNYSRPPWLALRRRFWRQYQQREELSVALAAIYHEPADFPLRMQLDESLYRHYCGRLLADGDELIDMAPSLLAASERARGETVATLCHGLLAGVARARDNELFVIVGTVPRERALRTSLIDAIRVARAALHRVVMIDVQSAHRPEDFVDPVAQRIFAESRARTEQAELLEFARQLGPLGAKIAQLEDARWMRTVAGEIDLIKSNRARVSKM